MSGCRTALVLVVLVVPVAWGCDREAGHPERPDQPGQLEGVVPEPGADPVRPDPPVSRDLAVPEAEELRTLIADTVRGWTGPGDRPFEVTLRTPGTRAHLYRRIGQETFALPARITDQTLVQYPCSSCHEGVAVTGDGTEDAHADIQPIHPSATGDDCTSCHVSNEVHRLNLPRGETVTMDHAYRLCAQCHFSETEAWAAGVHGKRLVGWHGRRVVMNCADCHDPHQPAIQTRIPFAGPQLPRMGGGAR